MFRLQLPTDPRWAQLAEGNLQEILTDHAFCEQKAASNAISIIVKYPEYDEVVREMSALAREELEHFQRVHQLMLNRGWSLGRERKDDYVNQLMEFTRKGGSRTEVLVERLLFAAMIEARSCERFQVLSTHIQDQELAAFYHELMISEANHYTLFITLARKYGNPEGLDVDKRWEEFLAFEGELIKQYGVTERIHG
jgi:tRNA 2-(methylsulfanyl)-N6-isopentenyladenosine37 hydroxylase